MNLERSIGFIFLISTILALGFLIEPQEQYKNNQKTNSINQIVEPEDNSIQVTQAEEVEVVIEEVPEIEIKEKSEPVLVDSTTDAVFLKESDFDLFVLRVHVLSSLENAETLSEKIKKGDILLLLKYLVRIKIYMQYMSDLSYLKKRLVVI